MCLCRTAPTLHFFTPLVSPEFLGGTIIVYMARRPLAVLLFAASIALALPVFTFAAGTSGAGLVPCGATSGPQSTECQACDLVQLLQKVIMFLIGLAIPIAVAMFAWAGILYFTSASAQENISKARSIFSSALFGFLIAITAWLVINTILNTILDKKQYPNSNWFHIDCSHIARQTATTITDVLNNTLGIIPVTDESPAIYTYQDSTAGSCNGTSCKVLVGKTMVTYTRGEVTTTKTGGTLAWRNNNPGNMINGAGGITPIGHSGGFAVFASYEEGYQAMIANLKTSRYQSQTIGGAIATWAPAADHNDPVSYANNVAKSMGVSVNTPMSSLSESQLNAMGMAIQNVEGYVAGQSSTSKG